MGNLLGPTSVLGNEFSDVIHYVDSEGRNNCIRTARMWDGDGTGRGPKYVQKLKLQNNVQVVN